MICSNSSKLQCKLLKVYKNTKKKLKKPKKKKMKVEVEKGTKIETKDEVIIFVVSVRLKDANEDEDDEM